MLTYLEQLANNDCFFLCGYKELADVIKSCRHYRGTFVWHKPNAPPAAFYPAKPDISFMVWAAKKSLLYGHQHWPSMVFSFSFPSAGCVSNGERFVTGTGKVKHPCQGPLDLYRNLLRPFPDDKVILDAYAGTGTCLRAAKDMGRKSIGIEIEERYCEIIANRLQQNVFEYPNP